MFYTEKPVRVEAVQFTEALAKASENLNNAKFSTTEKKKWHDFDEFFADARDHVDGTWLSIVNSEGTAEFDKWGIYCGEVGWVPFCVGDWGVRNNDGTFTVYSDDEFNARYQAEKTARPVQTPQKLEEK